MRSRAPALTLLLAAAACDATAPELDAGRSDASLVDASDGGLDPGAHCDALGLPRRPFEAGPGEGVIDGRAGDFTVATLDGPFTLSEAWSGCDSYVFLLHTASAYGEGLFAGAPDDLFTRGPRNVHYFFGGWDPEADSLRARMEAYRAFVDEGLEFQDLTEEDRAFWRSRIHYVVEPLRGVAGSLGEYASGPGNLVNTFAITAGQRFDPVGSLMDIGRAGFTPSIAMARFAAPYYDYLAGLDARLAAEDATVIPLIEGELSAARVIDTTVTLPDAAAMAPFDTFEIDVELTCRLGPDGCSEWDRIAQVVLCDDASCASSRELVRWITPYSRPGRERWSMEASPLLGLLREGGERTFRVVLGPDWEEATAREVSARLRFSVRGDRPRAIGAELAFRGGVFGPEYNTGRAPFAFTPPAATERVELVTIVSGHGMEADNCAEWCNHVHTFAIGGGERIIAFDGQAGTALGCADRTGEGVVPAQWGNWSPLRAGWCPGLPVAPVRHDVTELAAAGVESALTYRGSYLGGEPRGGHVELSTYVVYYADP